MRIKFIKLKALFWILFLLLSSIIFVNRAFVYDATITHAGLTKQAAELYNQEGKNKLNQEEIGWLSQGAVEEDTPLRWMNHFYDPVNNRGLSGMYDSAKVWSKDYNEQIGYARGNNTWQEAIYQYKQGHKKEAFIALGHILHLLEDMTVPAHTRDDAHPEGDPYEVWVRQNYKNVDAQMIYYNNLDTYFNYLSLFSNNNFYSIDTIDKFDQPKLQNLFLKDKCFYSSKENKIRSVCFSLDQFTNVKKYYLDNVVAADYFSLLAPKAVGAGAGVIKLFFEEVQKSQQYDRPFWQITLSGIIQQQTAGAIVPLGGKIKDRTIDAFKEVLNSGQKLIYDITNTSNLWDFFGDLWQTNTALAQDLKDLGNIKSNLALAPIKIANQAVDTINDSLGSSSVSLENVYQILRNLDASGSSGNGLPKISITLEPQPAVSNVPMIDNNLLLPEPLLPAVPIIPSNDNLVATVVNIINPFYSGSGGGGGSSPSSVPPPIQESLSTDTNTSSTPETNSSSTLENPPLTDPVTNTSSTLNTTTTPEIIIPDSNTTSTVSSSSTPESIFTDTASSTPEIPTSTTSTTSTPEITPPEVVPTNGHVVINEIAWGGTQAAANDEWLELYNASNFAVDLSGWILADGNDINFVFPTSTVIDQGEYFLMERTNNNTVTSHQANLIYKGSFFDGGEKLTLKNSTGVIIDEVSCTSKWFAGRNAYNKETMERKSAEVSGSESGNWQNTPMAVWQGQDVNGTYIAGTPGLPNSSVTYLDGILTADRTLSAGTYFLGNFSIPVGKTLRINPGVKIIGSVSSNIKVSGKLEILGTVDNPVFFTSYKESGLSNNVYLQDSNWGYIQILSGGQADIKNVQFNFGNSKWENSRPKGLIYADNATLNLDGVIFDKNLNERPRGNVPLINSSNSSLEIKNSQFLNSPKGLVAKGGSLNLSGNNFDGLGLSAVESEDLEEAVIENNTFNDLGWDYMDPVREYWERPSPLLSPVSFKNFLPEKIKGNTFENNILNSWEVYGKLAASGKIDTLGETAAIMGMLEIPAGINLEIKEGSIIKMPPNHSLKVFGSLLSRGGEGSGQIVFTSLHDDEYGGDVDLAEQQTTQKEGNEWAQILIQSSEPSVLDNTLVRFANAATAADTEGSVFVGGAPFSANNLSIEYSRVPSIALHLKDATGMVINGCFIKNENKRAFDPGAYNDGSGIWINGGNPQISNCVIDTFNFGLRLNPESQPELSNMEYKNVDFDVGL